MADRSCHFHPRRQRDRSLTDCATAPDPYHDALDGLQAAAGRYNAAMTATLLTLITVLVLGLSPQPVFAQAADDIKAVMRIETDGQPAMDMGYALGQEKMRLDMSLDLSIVSMTGDNPGMLMIQHAEKRYMEWGPQQLAMMQRMRERVQGGGGQDADSFDPTTLRFERTGQTQQIGSWNAFEVLMHGSDGQEGALWLTTETEIGLFELSARAAKSASMFRNPMTGGGGGGPQQFQRLRRLAEAQGLPDGRVVRIVSTDNGGGVITLASVETGPLPGDTFEAPAEYELTQMPVIPGIRE